MLTDILDVIDRSGQALILITDRITTYNSLSYVRAGRSPNEMSNPNDIHLADQIKTIDERLEVIFTDSIQRLITKMSNICS